MALLTTIDGVPLFSTQQEAVAWGESTYDISTFHTHTYNNQIGYMAGNNHEQITNSSIIEVEFVPVNTTTTTTTTTSSGY